MQYVTLGKTGQVVSWLTLVRWQEARGETAHYWYAYQTTGKRTRKRYLGQSARVTFAHLEEAASVLGWSRYMQGSASPEAISGGPIGIAVHSPCAAISSSREHGSGAHCC